MSFYVSSSHNENNQTIIKENKNKINQNIFKNKIICENKNILKNEIIEIIEYNKNQISPKNMKQIQSVEKSYGLIHQFFDPCNMSPPNDFMQKLHLRMDIYNKKEDNLQIA